MIAFEEQLMVINLAESIPEIAQCYPLLVQLHPYLIAETFVEQVQRMQHDRYQIAYLQTDDRVVSVAGFHIGESFAWRKYLYVDDLVTDPEVRSQGYGSKLLSWLAEYAEHHQCVQLHLDSRVTRHPAHKFYLNQGLIIGGYHFLMELR